MSAPTGNHNRGEPFDSMGDVEKLSRGDWVEYWTGEYELDFEDDGWPIRLQITETGAVEGETEDTYLVRLDSNAGGEPVVVPKDEEWIWLNEVDFVPSGEPNKIGLRLYSPKYRKDKVTETHGVALDPEFWAEHGIKPEVAEERGYSRWVLGHAKAPLEKAYEGIDLKPGQFTKFWTSANHAHGIIITRHKPPAVPGGEEYLRVFPEIRPDRPVPTRPPTKHYHGKEDYQEAVKAGLVAVELATGVFIHPGDERYEEAVKVAEKHIHRPENMKNHLKKWHPNGNVQSVHYHPHKAKYIFAPSPIKWIKFSHAHKNMKWKRGEEKPKNYDTHLQNWHADDSDEYIARCWENEHDHWYEGKPKGIYYDKEGRPRGHDYARRVDVHPWAVPLIKERKQVFFGIEGCLKADAILSQDAAVFSVPSVSLWEAPELDQFIEDYLMGKQVIIVPDADWYKKWQVIQQARFCQTYLKVHGVEAYVAAPPREAYEADPDIKGVDDFLGSKWGGRLEELEVIEIKLDEAAIRQAVKAKSHRIKTGTKDPYSNRVDGIARTLSNMALHSGADGTFSAPYETFSRVVSGWGTGQFKRSRQSIKRDLVALARMGLIAVQKGEVTIPADEITEEDFKVRRKWRSKGFDWSGLPDVWPVFTIKEKFRGKERRFPLADL